MTQAIQAYQGFRDFLSVHEGAAYAQLQVAMAHYKQMKSRTAPDLGALGRRRVPDYLQKYPNDPLEGKGGAALREVQEVLAEGDFRVGYYYFLKGDKKAAEFRLKSVARGIHSTAKADGRCGCWAKFGKGTRGRNLRRTIRADCAQLPAVPLVPMRRGG